jgi:Transposase DDE domain
LPTLSTTELTKLSHTLTHALSVSEVNQLGRETGQAKRLRTVTPHRLFLAMVSTLGSGRVESLADLLRAFNHQNRVDVAYKAFYNRLARIGFATFMRRMLARLLDQLRLQTLAPDGQQAVARFSDIVIHDGSSFALKAALAGTFPGRFATVEPAALEVHATYSGFADEVSRVQIAPDAQAERAFLPDPATLTDRLLLADRGYPSVAYFEAVAAHRGAFVIRLTRTYDPWIRRAWVEGRRTPVPTRIRLSRFLAQHAGQRLDLDVEFPRGARAVGVRVIALPGREAAMTRLCTNLPRTPFSLDLVARLYRFRWQIELCFKEWKSYANLHQFDTANPHIAEGLVWASLCAAVLKRFLAHAAQRVGGRAMSTRRVAMCAHHILGPLVAAVLRGGGLRAPLRRGLAYLLANARRANPDRDRRTGRLRAGLGLVEALK